MIIGEDFKFRDDIKADTAPIEILTEPYKGVILRYTKVGVKEQEEDDTLLLQFEYDLLEMGEHTETKLRRDVNFQEFSGLILKTLLLESLDAEEKQKETE
jgi:hypothetical protein